jgi:hypothetical protein
MITLNESFERTLKVENRDLNDHHLHRHRRPHHRFPSSPGKPTEVDDIAQQHIESYASDR